MENKYFIPRIEDIHSGYEYQVKRKNGDWETIKEFSNDYEDNPHYELMKDIEKGLIRVPYITKEQIEQEGWINTLHEIKVAGDFKRTAFIKDNYFLILDTFRDPYIQITFIDPSKDYRFMTPENFQCTIPCRDINTLKFIQSLLEIK